MVQFIKVFTRLFPFFFGVLLLFLSGCFSRFGDFSKAERAFLKGDCRKAAQYFSRLSKFSLKQRKFALKAARNCEIAKDYFSALFFYEAFLSEVKGDEDLKITKTVAEMLFYKIQNYEKALKYYENLRKQTKKTKEQFEAGYHISECFHHLQKYLQALSEVDKILSLRVSHKDRQKAVLLKSSVLMHLKDYETAVPFFREQIKEYPEKEEFFRQYLAFIFESQAKILAAIKELEKIKPSRPFLEKKIEALYKRLQRQPGVSL